MPDLPASGVGDVMVTVHQRLGLALVLVGIVGTAWGLLCLRTGSASPGLRAYARLAFLTVVVQGAVGLALVVGGNRPASSLHLVYGPAALLAAAAGILLGAGGDRRREARALTIGLAAVTLLAIRAVMTGAR